jgi:hypothetical protein
VEHARASDTSADLLGQPGLSGARARIAAGLSLPPPASDTCYKDERLVAFSCKEREVCPSCHAKRAHVTAVHLMELVRPHVPYR